MTMHYGETITAEEIWDGWKYHGRRYPMVYAVITRGDAIASNVWGYLAALKYGEEPPPVNLLFDCFPEKERAGLMIILNKVVSLYAEEGRESLS